MTEIPPFETAVADFSRFLSSRGHPTALIWVFRDDIWRRDRSRVVIRWPVPAATPVLAAKVYSEGRSRGIVGIQAIARAQDMVLATVWFPKYDEDEVQGWSANLKLTIADPLPPTRRVPSFVWPAVRLTPTYRHYQDWEIAIGTRKWAAAEQEDAPVEARS